MFPCICVHTCIDFWNSSGDPQYMGTPSHGVPQYVAVRSHVLGCPCKRESTPTCCWGTPLYRDYIGGIPVYGIFFGAPGAHISMPRRGARPQFLAVLMCAQTYQLFPVLGTNLAPDWPDVGCIAFIGLNIKPTKSHLDHIHQRPSV
jgi:hypothetical protein